MARPYPDKFERDISPLSPQSGGPQTPISYSANVNRQKTQKWVEAKPADYGGDDWGDDYDEYTAPPPPVPKTTGLRQPGQVVQTAGSGDLQVDEVNKKVYGDLPSLPTETQTRSVTSPVRDRANSFTRDDERRAFSGGYLQNPTPNSATSKTAAQGDPNPISLKTTPSNHPPALQVSTQVPSVTSLRKNVQPSSPATLQMPPSAVRGTMPDEPQSGTSSKYSEATSKYSELRTPSSDFQARRDFSPSAVPPPLQTRYSPGPQSAAADSPSSKFPPRKSSISQSVPPEVFQQPQNAQDLNSEKPWTDARSPSPGSVTRSPTTPAKGIPFIRPADIYRRMEEEREKERQSMDSSRPSMESIVGANSGERSSSPAKPPVRALSSPENTGTGLSRVVVQDSEDRVESGRRLAPMLEPVQERKSEYGFEGYDPAQALKSSAEQTLGQTNVSATTQSQPGFLSHDEMRRFSTSPKLPDLNRISGFGLDLFSHSGTDETSLHDSVLKSVSETSPSTFQNDPNLRAEPSPRFTSVVEEASKAENPSISDSPPSVAGGNVLISGSESASTSTAAISPIMSKLANPTPAITLNRESDPVGAATTSFIEANASKRGSKPASIVADVPERILTALSGKDVVGPEQNPNHPTNRSNISTPSPGMSPAMTTNVAATEDFRSGVTGHISTTPDPAISPVEEDPPAAARPLAERELSFRPNLPGGWVSYATSAAGSTVEQETRDSQRLETYNQHADPMDVPVSPISESEEDSNDIDLTPTTAKTPLAQFALGAAAGATFIGVTSAALGKRDGGNVQDPSRHDTSVQGLEKTNYNNAWPTPGPSLAPTGNPYAAATLDPRLQDELSTEHSMPSVSNLSNQSTLPGTSTRPPTPPPKDTPMSEPLKHNQEYFPPTVPLKHKTLDEVAASDGLVIPMRPQMLPTLSTQTSPQDEESDKLRKEIIKSLSPQISDAEAGQNPSLPEAIDNNQLEDSTGGGTRESTYLPSEYDNYWESTNEAEAEQLGKEAKARELSGDQIPDQQGLSRGSHTDVQQTHESAPPIPPLSPQRAERASIEIPRQRPTLPTNRFSWEAEPEHVSSKTTSFNSQLQAVGSGMDPRYAATPDSHPRQLEQTREAHIEHGPISTSTNTPSVEAPPIVNVKGHSMNTETTTNDHRQSAGSQDSSHSHMAGETLPIAAGVTGAAVHADQTNQHGMPQRRLSLAEEKNPVNASTYAVSPTPPEDEHPARVSQATPSVAGPLLTSQGEGRGPLVTPRPQQNLDVTKIIQFRDILAFQNPEQRIRAYNNTRDQFATMETGLSEWLVVLSDPDRNSWSDTVTGGGGAERAKVLKSNAQGVPGTPLQQPYYQQYLNASPTSSVPPARSGTGITTGTQQGFSPSGSKLSGQQTKSKDLLHTAGVFGGKASKAGKGLFTKGKNKLRGSGGGDKDSPPLEASPTPKPKVSEGRTSSWNMSLSSLTLPRSSGRASTPSQHSREATPPPRRQSLQGLETRPIVTPQRFAQPGSEIRPGPATDGQTELSIWDAPVSAASTPSIHPSTPQPHSIRGNYTTPDAERTVLAQSENEEQGKLGVPAPIGKEQPSWNPYNATPIVEEEGFQYEEHSRKQSTAVSPVIHPSVATIIPVDTISDRSTSGDAVFYDASEHPADSDDWVIVSKENVPKLSELSFAAPTAFPSNPVPQSNIRNQSSVMYPSSEIHQSRAGSQPFANYGPSMGHEPLAGYLPRQSVGHQPSSGNQPLSGNQPSSGYQHPAVNQVSTASQFAAVPPTSSQSPVKSQTQASQGGFRGRFIQHIRQRSSKDGNMPVPSQPSMPPTTAKPAEQPQAMEETISIEKRPTEFVGLPPIRRGSTFGIGFRSKDPSKRFPLDDDEDEEVLHESSGLSVSENGAINELEDAKLTNTTVTRSGTTDGFNNHVSIGSIVPGATIIAAAVGDRMNQPSAEPAQHIDQDMKTVQAATETLQRPPLSNVSSEYSRHSSFGPVSPPVSSLAPLPESRPALTTGTAQESVNTPTGSKIDTQKLYTGENRRPDTQWKQNVAASQELRTVPAVSNQSSPLGDARQNSSQTAPSHPSNPSFEGQRPLNLTHSQREPSFEVQRVRPSSYTNQGNAGTLPILNSGVFVPPPRVITNQQKTFDQPPSSAQRYPALFRAEHEGKAPSVDGLPANYYQAPISKEDAFLPRQQTNEYQLPGVGPPVDQPQSVKRSSRRNSALFKELGGRLSRSASRDRDSIIDDDSRSPIRPVDSRDSQSRDYSAASVTSEDTVEKKKRKSGLSFFGALRRESTGGPTQSRESMVTHLPSSRTDSLLQPSSPLVPPDKKKSFSKSSRGSPDPEKLKPNKLLRASTSSIVVEQTGKKKRFSGITSIFSKQNSDQERRGSNSSAVQITQDPRGYQQTIPPLQKPQYLEYPAQQTIPDSVRHPGQSGPSPQNPSQNQQGQYARGSAVYVNAGQNAIQPFHVPVNSPRPQRQESPAGRSGEPLPSPSFSVPPTLQHSVIETPPSQDRHNSQPYGPNWQNSQTHLRQTANAVQSVPLAQPAVISQSQQIYQRQGSSLNQTTPQAGAEVNSRGTRSGQQQTPSPVSQPIPKSQSPMDLPRSTQSSSIPLSVSGSQSPLNRPQQIPTAAQLSPLLQPQPAPQNLQSQSLQAPLVSQPTRFSSPLASPSTGQSPDRRTSYQQSSSPPTVGQGNGVPLQAFQQAQYQQLGPSAPQQANSRLESFAPTPYYNNQENQQMLIKQPPVQPSLPKAEDKQRQGSTARILSGLMGGRHSSGQPSKINTDSGRDLVPQQAFATNQQQPQLQPQQWEQQQRISSNFPQQGMPEQYQRGRPISQEPQYAPLPIPGAYNLVRGEGGQLAPTPYNPRGLNFQQGPYGSQQYIYREQGHTYPSQPQHNQAQLSANNHYGSVNHSTPPQIGIVAPQNTASMDMRPSPIPQQNSQNSQNSNKSTRPLSSEDLVARSPARPQPGQQAPYQLSLPDENADRVERDLPLPFNKNQSSENQDLRNGKPQIDRGIPTNGSVPEQQKFPPSQTINTSQKSSNPTLMHPQSPATYPLPDQTPFSPINPKADQIPPPPPPKWPQQTASVPSQNLDRSNTINTHASDMSHISGSQLSVPGPSESKEPERLQSVTPPSPQITPQQSPEQVTRRMTSSSQEEDVYSASPRRSVVDVGSKPTAPKAPEQTQEKILLEDREPQNTKRRTSQEEKILVEEGMSRPGSEQEEIPSMSATSYPGQEWHPYGNGYEEWD